MLTLLRHGLEETANVLHGWQDVDLVDQGVQQALRAADYYANTVFHHAYTSDLRRASETARLVATRQPALVPTAAPALRSLHLGLLNGRPHAEVGDKVAALWAEWRNGNDGLRAPEGESWREYQGRIYPFLFRAHQEATNAAVLAVSHSHVLSYAAAVAANGGRPLFKEALDLIGRFNVRPGQALDLSLGQIHRMNYLP